MLQNPAVNQGNNESNNDNDAMSLLSTFMLQGWVMTDQACKVPGCPVPIMRSKDGSIRFCVKHDTLPTTSANGSATKITNNNITTASPVVPQTTTTASPATTVVGATSGPTQSTSTEDDEYAERERQREQSSKASQLIGQRLLQRWTLLNETCPNPSCYAIPLMRDPSKRMVCVICDRTYNEDLEQESQRLDNTKETEDEPTEYKDEPTDDDRPEDETNHQKKRRKTDIESCVAPLPSSSTNERRHQQQRQKHEEKEAVLFSEMNDNYTSPIASKMRSLLRRVERTSDPIELKHLFEAIEAGANAMKACSKASETIQKIVFNNNHIKLDF